VRLIGVARRFVQNCGLAEKPYQSSFSNVRWTERLRRREETIVTRNV
jgi:hypothetical protein